MNDCFEKALLQGIWKLKCKHKEKCQETNVNVIVFRGLFLAEAITRCLSELEAGQFGMGDSSRKDCNSQAAGSGVPNYVYNYCYQRAIQRINYCSITPNCRGFNKQSSKLSYWVHSVANITEWPVCKQTIHLLCIRIRTNTHPIITKSERNMQRL